MSENNMKKNYSRKHASDFNIFTKLYQLYALVVVYFPFTSLFYSVKIKKHSKLPKKPYILAPNHISYLDPFLATRAAGIGFAYMAKKELFEESNYVAKNISRLGAFAVNREKLEVSTIKSAKEVFKAGFNLCIFPQGGIRKNKKIENVNKGFAVLAKMVKADIVPMSITGVETYNWNIFKHQRINIEIGTPISYLCEEEKIIDDWKKQVSDMAQYELV